MTRSIVAAFAKRITIPDLRWMPDDRLTPTRLGIELLSGLTVALALVPEAVAFAFVAGVHPLVGLYAAFIVGLI
ncbi:MAG: sodium-independent anion transporter, partial [Rhodobacteraceae bacterium]|nr:sodium-independent anion transporter [Paracoccaceae bacterium]